MLQAYNAAEFPCASLRLDTPRPTPRPLKQLWVAGGTRKTRETGAGGMTHPCFCCNCGNCGNESCTRTGGLYRYAGNHAAALAPGCTGMDKVAIAAPPPPPFLPPLLASDGISMHTAPRA